MTQGRSGSIPRSVRLYQSVPMAEHHQASAVHWEENGKGIAKAATNGDECLGPGLHCHGLAKHVSPSQEFM